MRPYDLASALFILMGCAGTVGSDATPETNALPDDAAGVDVSPRADAAEDARRAIAGCAGTSYKLCEDFDSVAVGSLPPGWIAEPGSGATNTVTVVAADEHHSGGQSLKSAVAANGQARAAHSLKAEGALAGKHWGRIFYKVQTPTPVLENGVIHNTLVSLKGSSESRVVDTVVNNTGKHQFLYGLPDDSCCTPTDYIYSSYDGQWHCAEWSVDASTQSYRFFFDEVEVKSMAFSFGADLKARIESYDRIVLGWIDYQSPNKPYYEAWFDDLAMDDSQIGCR